LANGTPDLNFVLQPQTIGLNIGIENNTDPTGLLITQANIDAFDGDTNGGFSSITIGRSDSSGIMRINTFNSGTPVVFDDPVFFRMPDGDIEVFDAAGQTKDANGFLNVASLSNTDDATHFFNEKLDVDAGGTNVIIRDRGSETPGNDASFGDETRLDASFTFLTDDTTTLVAGRVETDGTPITYIAPVELTGDTEMVTTGTIGTGRATSPLGADIKFESTLDGQNAGLDDIIFIAGGDDPATDAGDNGTIDGSIAEGAAGDGGDILFLDVVGQLPSSKLGNVLVSDDDSTVIPAGYDASGLQPWGADRVQASDSFRARSLIVDRATGDNDFADDLITRGTNLGAGGLEIGGVVTIRTLGNVSITGTTDTQGGTAVAASAGNPGGDVTVIGANVTVGAINTSGSNATAGGGAVNGGDAGDVVLDADNIALVVPLVGADVNNGGLITLGTNAGGGIDAIGGNGAAGGIAGNGGDVTVGDDEVAVGADVEVPDGQVEDNLALGNALVAFNTTGGDGVTNFDGNILFDGILVGGGRSVTMDVGPFGSFTTEDFNDTVTGIGTWTVTNAAFVTFNGSPTAFGGQVGGVEAWEGTAFVQVTGTGATVFNGAVTAGGGGMIVRNERVVFGDNLVGGDGAAGGVTGLTPDATGMADQVTSAFNVLLRIDIDDDTAPLLDTAEATATALTLANPGPDTLVINANAPFNVAGTFQQTGAGANSFSIVELGADITTTGGNTITFEDHVMLTESVTVSTTAGIVGDIVFGGNVFSQDDGVAGLADDIAADLGDDMLLNGSTGVAADIADDGLLNNSVLGGVEALTLIAGGGNITVSGKVGTEGMVDKSVGTVDAPISRFVVNNAQDSTYADTVLVYDFLQIDGTGETEFQGFVTVQQDYFTTSNNILDSTTAISAAGLNNDLDDRTGFFVRTSGRLFFNTGAGLAVINNPFTAPTGANDGTLAAAASTVESGANVIVQVGDIEFGGGANTVGIEEADAGEMGVLVIEPFLTDGALSAGNIGSGVVLDNSDVDALADGVAGTGLDIDGAGPNGGDGLWFP
jgi:hypothetical protein